MNLICREGGLPRYVHGPVGDVVGCATASKTWRTSTIVVEYTAAPAAA